MINLFKRPSKEQTIFILVGFFTTANLGVLAFLGFEYNKAKNPARNPNSVVIEKKIEVVNAKKKEIDQSKTGQKIGTGFYAYEDFKKSKISEGSSAELVVASHEKTGANFLLAFLEQESKPKIGEIENGWSMATIANDPMWSPGACASKPTFLVRDDYIFIDDGKTNPDDKYNSYVLFDIKKGIYRYIGGNKFTPDQGNKERIMFVANEDDKLVYYIDPVDNFVGSSEQYGQNLHVNGQGLGYVIRRVVDPDTLKYEDYSLPYTVPNGVESFTIDAYSNIDNSVTVSMLPQNNQNGNIYEGNIKNNSIEIKAVEVKDYVETEQIFDSELELALNPLLIKSLPLLSKQKPYKGAEYKTLFSAFTLGSFNDLEFLEVAQRYGTKQEKQVNRYGEEIGELYYATPLVYDKSSLSVYPLTTKPIMESFRDFVSLGVF